MDGVDKMIEQEFINSEENSVWFAPKLSVLDFLQTESGLLFNPDAGAGLDS